MPERIQRQRTKGWRMPEGAIYVGRPSRWGNQFRTDDDLGRSLKWDRETVVELHRLWITAPWMEASLPWLIEPLRGHDLACWCPLDQPCHADVLLELANRQGEAMTESRTQSDQTAQPQEARRYLSEMGEVERSYTLAVHDLYCGDEPKGHAAADHEPFDGVDDPDELVPWSEVVAALARHGLVLATLAVARSASTSEGLREALERARNDLLAYGYHLDGEWVNRGGNPETHRRPGDPCRCGLDAAIASASAALGNEPQTFRDRVALEATGEGSEEPSHPFQPGGPLSTTCGYRREDGSQCLQAPLSVTHRSATGEGSETK